MSSLLDNPITRIATAVVVAGIFFVIVFAFLPEYSLPDEFSTALDWVFESLWAFDFIIPVSVLITCFYWVLLTDIILMSLKLMMWVKKHLTQQH